MSAAIETTYRVEKEVCNGKVTVTVSKRGGEPLEIVISDKRLTIYEWRDVSAAVDECCEHLEQLK